jgi:hypothetical protein
MPTVEGKAYWAAITRPNTTFDPVYQIDVAVDDTTAKDFASRGVTVKEDERGKVLKFKRKVARADGTANPMPRLVDNLKNPLDVLVGNGSQVKVLYKEFEWTFAGKSGRSLDLQAVQVIDLIPYGEDFDVTEGYVVENGKGSTDEF